MSYVYINSEPGLWTVGFYAPDGRWNADSDFETRQEAADRCTILNGGTVPVRALAERQPAPEPERRWEHLPRLLDAWCACHRDGTTKDLLRGIVDALCPVAAPAVPAADAELVALRQKVEAIRLLCEERARKPSWVEGYAEGACDAYCEIEMKLAEIVAMPKDEVKP